MVLWEHETYRGRTVVMESESRRHVCLVLSPEPLKDAALIAEAPEMRRLLQEASRKIKPESAYAMSLLLEIETVLKNVGDHT